MTAMNYKNNRIKSKRVMFLEVKEKCWKQHLGFISLGYREIRELVNCIAEK